MAKHKDHQTEGAVAVEEQEAPKTKVGDKPVTAVDGKEAKERKPRASKVSSQTFRILDGVDATKFAGQRGHVIRAMQKLDSTNPGAMWTLKDIVDNTEGLVSKTPVEASVSYHLKGLVADGQVVASVIAAPAPAAEVAA
jgi:hypothetical protein